MAHTISQLLAARSARLAYVLEIEGVETVYTTSDDTAGISTAWGGRTAVAALQTPPGYSRELNLLDFDVQPESRTFRLVDVEGAGLASLFAEDLSTGVETYLTQALDRDDTTVYVADESNFSGGVLHVGHERMTYGGSAAGSFTSVTRGGYGYGGKATWSHSFAGAVGTLGARVTDYPAVWKYRGISLYVTAVDVDSGTWLAKANALLDFVGHIRRRSFSTRTGEWSLDCESIEARFSWELLRSQFAGEAGGFRLKAETWTLLEYEFIGDTWTETDISIPAGAYTLDGLVADLNALFAAAGTDHDWSVALESGETGSRARISVSVTPPTGSEHYALRVKVSSSEPWQAASILGWPAGDDITVDEFNAVGTDPEVHSRTSPEAPVVAVWSSESGSVMSIVNARGTWADQAVDDGFPIDNTDEGFVFVGGSDILHHVRHQNGADATLASLTVLGRYRLDGETQERVLDDENTIVRMGAASELAVRQVWVTSAPLVTLLLRMLLSTGTANYNSSTYDKWPATLGVGVPSTLVDIASLAAIGTTAGAASQQRLVITEPTPAIDEIRGLMVSAGFHLVWRNGMLTPVVPLTIQGRTADWTLDESNTGSEPHAEVTDGSDLARTRMTLKCNRDPIGGDYRYSETYDHVAAQDEQEKPDGFEYEARSLHDNSPTKPKLSAWRENVAAPTVAYFANRGLRVVKRSGSRALLGIALGDIVALTEPDVPSQTSGTYGITSAKGWVIGYSYDPESCEFPEITVLVPTGKAYPMAPSLMLDYTRPDHGYDGSHQIHWLQHEFSYTHETIDTYHLRDYDRLRIVEADPSDSASPLTWTTEMEEFYPDEDGCWLTDTLAGFVDSKRYYVELDDYDTACLGGYPTGSRAIGEQYSVAFTADADDYTVQDNAGVIFQYGSGLPNVSGYSIVGTDTYRRIRQLDATDGEPASVHKFRDLCRSINNCIAYTTLQQPICSPYVTVRSVTGETYGYIGSWVVHVPPGHSSISIVVLGYVSADTGTFRATSGTRMPGGTVAAPTFGGVYEQATGTTDQTALTAVTISLPIREDGEHRTYITLEAKNGNANETTSVRGVFGRFTARSLI